MSTPVFITGIGIVSPAGRDTEENWRALVGGQRSVRLVEDPLLTGGGAACGGLIGNFEPPAGVENHDRVCQLAAAAADEAVRSADLAGREHPPAPPDRLAVSFGTSKGGILSFTPAAEQLRNRTRASSNLLHPPITTETSYHLKEGSVGLKEALASNRNYLFTDENTSYDLLTLLSDILPDAPARQLARRYGARAGAHATVAACATGALAVIRGIQAIADGQADIVVAGSSDASLHPLWFAAFRRMGVLAEALDADAARACRPFDAHRRGFAIAEGAAALVLESRDSVRRRRIAPLARIRAWATGSDPAGLAQLSPDGAPLAEIARIACARAAAEPARIAAIQAHGTGTLANDAVEINAIRRIVGPGVEVPVVSIKGAVGHLLGAAGAVELAVAALAASRRRFPPNATLVTPDPAFAEVCLPTEAVRLGAGPILKLSMGFGGHLAAVLVDSA